MQVINHFSFLFVSGALLLIVGWAILHRTAGVARWLSLAALMAGIIFSYSLFTPGPGDATPELTLVDLQENAAPTLLEFESPFCLGCIAAQPILDGIRREHAGRLDVVQINILAPGSEHLKDRFAIQFTPTFVFLTGKGEEAWRSVGTVDPEQVRSSLNGGT